MLFVVVSAVAFGSLAIFARLAYDAGGEPVAVLFLRFAIAAGVMAAVMTVRGEPWPRGGVLLGCVLLGAIGYVGQSLAFFSALRYAPASLVSLLLYLYPAIVVALSVGVLGERLTRAKLVAVVLAVIGSALTIGPVEPGRAAGIVLGVLSAVVYSVYIAAGAKLMPCVRAIPAATVIISSAAVVYGVLALLLRPAFPSGAQGVLAVAGIALVATALAIVAFFAGLARVGPTEASTLSAFEPAVTVALAAVLLGERLATVQLLGGALILSAVVVLSRHGAPVPAQEPTGP